MKKIVILCFIIAVLINPLLAAKPRIIVLTDISNEPDDEESMVRFLVYSNEFNVEGLIATTSVWLQNTVRPERIIERIQAYGMVRDNLIKHADGYPTVQQLVDVTRSGLPEFGMEGVGQGKSSPGSNHIIRVIDEADPQEVWISVWGGANCLAQALWDVKNTRSPELVKKFVDKLRIYTISDQDNSGRWIRQNFPGIFYIVSPSAVSYHEYHQATWTGISGDRFYKNAPMHQFSLVDNPWLIENIIENHGPLGALYPKLEYIMEGDTPSFLGLIDNGLASHTSPAYGGWGGRYELNQTYAEAAPIWTNTRDSRDTVTADNGITVTSDQATIWRWRQAYQHDFAARMDWCIADDYSKANHNPIAIVNGLKSKDPLVINSKPGIRISLSAAGSSDPDSNAIAYNWFEYPEAGTCRQRIKIDNPKAETVSISLPDENRPSSIHVILEVKDAGLPSLYSYRRIIINIKP